MAGFDGEEGNSEELGKDLTSTFVILRFMGGGKQKRHNTEKALWLLLQSILKWPVRKQR